MGETAQILELWRRARAQSQRVCLATVVHIEGSSYRKPGARMLLTSGGERAGTLSGGCLEAEVSRKAWWLTENGPTVQRYRSSFDEDDPTDPSAMPFGLGCGGTIWVLLEQEPEFVLACLAASVEESKPAVMVAQLTGKIGTRVNVPEELRGNSLPALQEPALQEVVEQVRAQRESRTLDARLAPAINEPVWFIEYLAAPPRLTLFGAGDDAQPIVRFADALGWRVAVADGRANLLRRERFPEAAELRLLEKSALQPGIGEGELAVLLTHSFERDRELLTALLPQPLLYLGILGPRHRTERLLSAVAPALGWSIAQCWDRLHAPVGLDLGASDPAAIALSIVAELQATLLNRRVTVERDAKTGAERELAHVSA